MSGKKEKKAINLIGSKSRKKSASKKRRDAARGQQKTRGRSRRTR
jgi:hypothetical protein